MILSFFKNDQSYLIQNCISFNLTYALLAMMRALPWVEGKLLFSLLILPPPHEFILYALQRVIFRPFLAHKSHCLI